MNDHRELREALGGYVLGRLEPGERHTVEEHLADCQSCRDTVASLSGLPPLLEHLEADEVRDGVLAPPDDLLDGILRRLGDARRGTRRRLIAWRVAAVAAAAAAVVIAAPWSTGPDVRNAPVRVVAADARPVTGTAGAIAWEWGTTVQVNVDDLPARDAYLLWAVAEDGQRQQAGTWGPTADGEARVRGACSIPRERLERVEVTDTDGQVLFAFDF